MAWDSTLWTHVHITHWDGSEEYAYQGGGKTVFVTRRQILDQNDYGELVDLEEVRHVVYMNMFEDCKILNLGLQAPPPAGVRVTHLYL